MIGQKINNRYLIDSEMGRGGMGVVYRARDTVLDRVVAIKVVSSPALGTEGRARILQEARAAAALNHPNIVAVYDVDDVALPDQITTTTYIVMEFVAGPSLRDYKVESFSQALDIAGQVCEALAEAHDHGIIHRDLKPENVLVSTGKSKKQAGTRVKVKLMDFGLARITGRTRLTQEGAFMGTLSYLAPEIILGQPASKASDLYALGVMYYELLAGRPPFEGDTPTAILSQHLHAPVVPPSTHNPEISPTLDALIAQLLGKTPDVRPDSAHAVSLMLTEVSRKQEEPDFSRTSPALIRLHLGLMVGRENEFAEATAIWGKALSSEGQLLLISGEPGVGKTRLMRELTTHAEVLGGNVVFSECYAEGGMVYMPVAQAIRTVLGNGLKVNIPDETRSNLLLLTPELRPSHKDLPEPARLDPEFEQMRLFESMVLLCDAISKIGPLMFVVDDIHWADSGTLALVRHLARRTRHKPVMIVAAYRELELDEARPFNNFLLDLTRERLVTRIKLARLNHEQTGRMLASLFGVEMSRDFHDRMYRETEGNPFFIEELCKALVDNGQVYFSDGQWQRVEIDELEIPQSIRVVVQGRVGHLPDETQEILKVAALIGREFDFNTLVKASDIPEDSVIDALELAEEAQLIGEVSHEREVVFAFSHGLIPSTLADSIRVLRRRRMHRRVARAIESLHPDEYEDLAFHYGQAGVEDKAYHYYVKSGERALANFANQDAIEYLQAALDLVEDQSDKAKLLTHLGEAQANIGLFDELNKNWRTAIEIYRELGDLNGVAYLYARLSNRAWDTGDFTKGLEIGLEGLALLKNSPPSADLAFLMSEAGRASFFVGKLSEAQPIILEALEMAEDQGAIEVQAESLINLTYFQDRSLEEKITLLEQAIELAKEANLPKTAARGLFNLAIFIWDYSGDTEKSLRHFAQALEMLVEIGDLSRQRFFTLPFIWHAIGLGDVADMKKWQRKLKELLEAAPSSSAAWQYRLSEAVILWWQGLIPEAETVFRQAVTETEKMQDLQSMNNAADFLSILLIEDGRLEEAYETATWWLEALGESIVIHPDALVYLVTVCSRLGRIDEGHRFAEQFRSLSEFPTYGLFESMNENRIQAELGVANRNWPVAMKAFSKLTEAQKRTDGRFYRTYTLMDWARALILKGRPEDLAEARGLAEEAHAEFVDMGLAYFIEKSRMLIEELT